MGIEQLHFLKNLKQARDINGVRSTKTNTALPPAATNLHRLVPYKRPVTSFLILERIRSVSLPSRRSFFLCGNFSNVCLPRAYGRAPKISSSFFVPRTYPPPQHNNDHGGEVALLAGGSQRPPYRQTDVHQGRIGGRRIGNGIGQPSAAADQHG